MPTSENSQKLTDDSESKLDRFLVCGLGSLGQHCVAALKEYGVSVIAIDEEPPKNWEIPNLPYLLDDVILGDCRLPTVLQQAMIRQCRAVLLVTNDERVNIEAALEIRELNRHTRLVVRSAQENLNQLLAQRLGNFIAFEPTELPAAAFALAALGTEALGFFNLEGQWLRVVEHQIQPSDRWYNINILHEFNSNKRHILYYSPHSTQKFQSFYEWEPDTPIQVGDTLIYIEITEPRVNHPQKSTNGTKKKLGKLLAQIRRLKKKNLRHELAQLWEAIPKTETRRLAAMAGLLLFTLLIVGTVLFKLEYPNKTNFKDAINITIVLLLGGFDNVFGAINMPFPISWWMYLFSIGLTVAGTIFVGLLYAMLTEKVIASRFQLQQRRPRIPKKSHVVIIGLDRVGQQVATLLKQFQQPLVAISLKPDFDRTALPQVPLIVGKLNEVIGKANLATAKSVIVATDNEMLNLEVGLMARAANPNSHLTIRTFEQRLTDNLPHLLPDANVLHANSLAAEAFASAAFGENILNLFRIHNQSVLVAEYNIKANDNLNGLLLAEITYGYEVVPILYQKIPNSANLMPSEDIRLSLGDRLVVLATIDGLRRIEQGVVSIVWRCYKVRVEEVLSDYSFFEGANLIARISGCDLTTARSFMNNLPSTLRSPLYKHQAQRLVRELNNIQILAHIIAINS